MRVTQIGLISFIVFVVLNIMKQHGAKYDIQTLGQNCGIYNCKIVRRNSNANANGGGPFMSGCRGAGLIPFRGISELNIIIYLWLKH